MDKKQQITKGYKVTDQNLKCRSFQFEIGKIFKQSGSLQICNNGFHFCKKTNDCFNYYNFNTYNRVFEISAIGDIVTDGDKSCCLEIKIEKELTWLEVLELVNVGKNNTGRKNTGAWNTGDRNTGAWNTGAWNTGDRNTGDRNTGDRNTGDRNTGAWNTGAWNTGAWNTGAWNTGDRNTGDSNTGYRNTGAFCTNKNPKVFLFDKETDIEVKDWERHEAVNIMANYLYPNIWVDRYNMTDEEKTKFPTFETTGGYLKSIPMHEAWSNMWHNLSNTKKKVFLTLPNFDKNKFKEITGIDV